MAVTGGVLADWPVLTAQEDPRIKHRQMVALRAVEAWFEILTVQADPAYVEVGDNDADLSAAIANVANVPWSAPATVEIHVADGTI